MLSAKGIIALAIAGILAIFLSSVVPVHADNPFSGAQSFDVSMDKELPDAETMNRFITSKDPVMFYDAVPYLDFDISKEIDPWYDIMAKQLAIGTYDRSVARDEMLGMPPQFGDWLLNSLGLFLIVSGVLGVGFVGFYYFDWLKKKLA